MTDRDVIVSTRIPKADRLSLIEIVDEDIQWNNLGHLLYVIIHSWIEEQRAKKREQLEKTQ